VLEDLLADRTNFDASWISDLSTRSESSGGTFVALGVVAALALLLYGVELVAILGERGKLLRRGRSPSSSPRWRRRSPPRRRFAIATFAFGTVWLVLTILTGVSYLSDEVDEIKGAFQRIDQVLFGVWLVVLACAASARSGAEE
jgi:hypothetical protein